MELHMNTGLESVHTQMSPAPVGELRRVRSPLGSLLLVTGPEGEVRALDFSASRLRRSLQQHYGACALVEVETASVSAVEARLEGYFGGQFDALDDIEIAAQGTAFQRKVWAALRKIPAGQVTSYAELARRLGFTDPRMAREVGLANAANPVAIVVPCHRVIGSDGDLKGYAWGLDRKRWLLAHEKAEIGSGVSARLPGF
jgi:methylated-DNA-[protein]-cysteine S-methyltransferase